jgi:nucleoside-triphosphatase THEP1
MIMVTIIAGPKGAGKTSALKAHFEKQKSGDGIVQERVFEGERVVGYRLRRLATGETHPLAFERRRLPQDWIEETRHGRFSFSAEGIAFAQRVVQDVLASNVEPLYIDEVGKLEIQGGGHAEALRDALRSGKDLVLCVRDINVADVVRVFGIAEHELVRA